MKRFLGILAFLMGATCYAQENPISSFDVSAEKVYLQRDRTAYTTNQTIWFKAIVTDALTHQPAALSGVLYVELIGPDEKIVERKLVKIVNGSGNSFFELHDNLIAGNYVLRAYTEWNKNFGSDFIFEQYLQIFSSVAEESPSPITEVTLVEKKNDEFWLTARLKPDFYGDEGRHNLKVYLDIDGKKDTLDLKLKSDDQESIIYAVPKDTRLAALTLETEDKRRYYEAFSFDTTVLDVQFFPESGVMVDGLPTKVGFKVLNDKGVGVAVKGSVYTADNELLTSLESNALGMGAFFIHPKYGTSFHATIEGAKRDALVKYHLPEVVEKGTILSVIHAHNNIGLTVATNMQESDSVFIKVEHRGTAIFLIRGKLESGRLLSSVAKDNFPEGILVFTLLNSNEQPIAQRLYFNENLDRRLKIKLSPEKKTYLPREKTVLDIAISSSRGEPVQGNLSALAIDKEVFNTKTNSNNIVSYFLLDSELKGEIENPKYYFDPENKNRLNDIDALLLTQGWRKYVFRSPDALPYYPESGLNLRGVVYSAISKKKKKEAINLKLLTFGEVPTFKEFTTDTLGRFNFELDDVYGTPLEVLVQSANAKGKNKNYHIALDQKKTPKITFDHIKSIRDVDSIIYEQVDTERRRSIIEDTFEMANGVTQLDEVIVEAERLTPQRKLMLDSYGAADVIIQGKDIRAKKNKWSYGLYSILMWHYPEDLFIERFPDGFMLAHIIGGGATLVVIDGVPVVDFDYKVLPYIPASEVKSVELIRYAENFKSLYLKAFPWASAFEIPATGSIIAIYTHGGFGLHSIEKPQGIIQATLPVFSPEREFYAPRYDTSVKKEAKKPDLRSLIHWAPEIKFGSTETTSIDFYNSDIPGEKLILIEAIAEDGSVGYQELVYEVAEDN